jgi:hypothetical protein
LDGAKVGDDYADMWDGTLDNYIKVDESGNTLTSSRFVWTGSRPDGTNSGWYLGHWYQATFGATEPYKNPKGWIEAANNPTSLQYRLYGLSEKLTAPGGVIPEPSTLVIWSLLAVFGLTVAWRRRRK